jgi:hypothetical protein
MITNSRNTMKNKIIIFALLLLITKNSYSTDNETQLSSIQYICGSNDTPQPNNSHSADIQDEEALNMLDGNTKIIKINNQVFVLDENDFTEEGFLKKSVKGILKLYIKEKS